MACRSEQGQEPAEQSEEGQGHLQGHFSSSAAAQQPKPPPPVVDFRMFCPNCRNALITPRLLELCGHVLCKECYEMALSTDYTQVTCPFHTCKQQMSTDHVSKMASGHVDRLDSSLDDDDEDEFDPSLYPGMEPALVKLALEHGWEGGKVRRRPKRSDIEAAAIAGKRKNDDDGGEDDAPTCASGPPETSQQQNEDNTDTEPPACKGGNFTCQYVTTSTAVLTYSPEHSKDFWLAPVKLDAGIHKDTILQRLCEAITTKEDYIMGYYACNQRDKIVIDISAGEAYVDKTHEFLGKTFTDIHLWEKNFVIEEQEFEAEEIVGSAAKIVDELKNGVRSLFTTENNAVVALHPDRLTPEHGYGTVTCLAETAAKELYALTSKHVFSTCSDQESEIDTKIYASVNNCVKEIGRKYRGLKGPIQLDDNNEALPLNTPNRSTMRNRAVDIAAVPIIEDITRRLDGTMMKNMTPCFSDVDDEVLKGVEVTKHGAASGTTKGKIIQNNYFVNRRSLVSAGYQLIAPNEYFTSFANKGDSGSLVCSVPGTPIGIVIESWRHKYQGQVQNSTVIVRLDNCLKALEKCDIPIKQCKLYCAPPPIDPGVVGGTPIQG